MRIKPSILLIVLACLASLPSCTGTPPPTPSTPPTFVLAWTGTDSLVHTLQSTDGTTWVLPATAPGPSSTHGVSVAHDGRVNWMVLWNSATTLRYITGIGGLPSATATTGITWQSTSNTFRASPVSSTPAVAFGNQKWAAVYLGSSNRLRFVSSILDSTSTTNSDVDTGITSGSFSPGLAFGVGKFVLAYLDGSFNLVSRTSTDGLTWSSPNTIFPVTSVGGDPELCEVPTGVTLSFANGAFYAVGRQSTTVCSGGTQAGGSAIVVYRSPDGASWTTIVNRSSGPTVNRNEAGIPSGAFAQCHLVVAYTQTQIGTSPNIIGVPNHLVTQIGQPPDCSNPASFTFGAPATIGGAATAQLDSVMAVVFGSGQP